MEKTVDAGTVVLEPSGYEDLDVGRGWRLERVLYHSRTRVEIELSCFDLSRPKVLTYDAMADRFKMDAGMDWFLSEGGRRDALARIVREWLDEADSLNKGGEPRRQRPSPKVRNKHVQDR